MNSKQNKVHLLLADADAKGAASTISLAPCKPGEDLGPSLPKQFEGAELFVTVRQLQQDNLEIRTELRRLKAQFKKFQNEQLERFMPAVHPVSSMQKNIRLPAIKHNGLLSTDDLPRPAQPSFAAPLLVSEAPTTPEDDTSPVNVLNREITHPHNEFRNTQLDRSMPAVEITDTHNTADSNAVTSDLEVLYEGISYRQDCEDPKERFTMTSEAQEKRRADLVVEEDGRKKDKARRLEGEYCTIMNGREEDEKVAIEERLKELKEEKERFKHMYRNEVASLKKNLKEIKKHRKEVKHQKDMEDKKRGTRSGKKAANSSGSIWPRLSESFSLCSRRFREFCSLLR